MATNFKKTHSSESAMKVSVNWDPIVLMVVGRRAVRYATCVLILVLVHVWNHGILYEKKTVRHLKRQEGVMLAIAFTGANGTLCCGLVQTLWLRAISPTYGTMP